VQIDLAGLRDRIRDIADFPQPGVIFRDITPLLADPVAFGYVVDGLADPFRSAAIKKVVGVEARGFIVATPVAERLQSGFVPVRKAGKLPWQTAQITYDLEYGTDSLEVHRDAFDPGDRVLIVDDVLATGGTAAATIELVESLGATVVGLSFLIELTFLDGRSRLADRPVESLIRYD
jgi:adenine phosphoribosyltransferase